MEENVTPSVPPPLPPVPPVPGVPGQPVVPTTMICQFCGVSVPVNSIFCPACGKQLKDKQLSVTLFTKISLYALAIFLPPMGYWPAIKYFKSYDPEAQKLGMYLILVTTLSTIITIWLTFVFVQSYLGDINSALSGTGITPSQAMGGLL